MSNTNAMTVAAYNRLIAARARHDGAAQHARKAIERIEDNKTTREHEVTTSSPEIVKLVVHLCDFGEPGDHFIEDVSELVNAPPCDCGSDRWDVYDGGFRCRVCKTPVEGRS